MMCGARHVLKLGRAYSLQAGSGIGSMRANRNIYPEIPRSRNAVAATNAPAKEWVDCRQKRVAPTVSV